MKKRIISITVVTIIFSALIVYSRLFVYGNSSSNHDFPIPKAADLIKTNQHTEIYNWIKASEENGVPSSYMDFIEQAGWEEGDREGAAVYYTKGDHTVEVISTTNQLTIIY
ncbi:hypothetical protein M3E13_18830 [Oceanobacillus kimchii]|uniref:hypothetical protein n=1 Tax=Oceanobacillus kimchii TaxID=746691 RepID=UPI0021A48375|nr:hypothetical protein [Oceanobacillus kimchii]MCT1579153.1 hypothetical protein [Oceanobacillus kimchii]MCT2137954.1 hypothetical protein [Oceanobacillus kimchii]